VTIGTDPRNICDAVMTGALAAAAEMHSGHCQPTDAEFMQDGQIGRSHRWQLTPAERSGWR
jgi:hypothetical protein